VGKRFDDLPTRRAKSARAIGDLQTSQPAQHALQQPTPRPTDSRLSIVGTLIQKSRTNHEVKTIFKKMPDQADDLFRSMLTIPIDLNRNVISVTSGITVTRLHRAADA